MYQPGDFRASLIEAQFTMIRQYLLNLLLSGITIGCLGNTSAAEMPSFPESAGEIEQAHQCWSEGTEEDSAAGGDSASGVSV